ncbi:hypothetical protein I4U23_020496 [Adineta vaga]|nr:hypothetical protein I4U23_020496 [Adineta vaga]
MHFKSIFLIFFIFSIQRTFTQIPPVVPLTNALTAIYCHNLNEVGTMTIRCRANEKIRMLDAFDVVVRNRSHLPLQCLKQKPFSMVHGDISTDTDCKVHTSFASACSGRENCTLHMQRIRLNSVKERCHNELVDYTMAFFECISDVFIHDICSTQAITSPWGTLKTPNFPNPYTSNDDCWCAGLYLQSSDEQRSTQCTYLQPGHNYLSDTNALYINFYSRTSTVRGGFWIIYEASHANAEVHLQCGSREKLGVPSSRMSTSSPSPPISSSYNYGWSRLIYNDPPNPSSESGIHDHMMHMRLFHTTTPSIRNRNFKVKLSSTSASAFTYPYGHLATFDLDFGPRGWFVKYPYGSSNMTATKFLQTTTTPTPIVKWNSTWLYVRRLRTRVTFAITTTEQMTTAYPSFSSIIILTTTPQSITIDDSFTSIEPFVETVQPKIISAFHLPPSSSTSKTTLPVPTPWYQPAGLYDWWQWQHYTTKLYKTSVNNIPTTKTSISSTQSTITTTTTTTTVTTTTTTPVLTTKSTTRSSTTKRLVHLSNTTNKTSITSTKEITVDWFRWPHTESTRAKPDYYDDDYPDWFDYLPTNKLKSTSAKTTTTRNPFLSILSEPGPKQYQQLSLLPTKPDSNMINIDVTSRTSSSSSKLDSIQKNTGEIAHPNAQNNIQEQSKKESEEYGWLSKTAVGEIVLWDEKDQGGYMIDNHGEWAKIEGRQWLGNSLLKNQNKTSFTKSFRSRFQFIRQSHKKSNPHRSPAPPAPKQLQHHQQQIFKFPFVDSTTLTPVPEADDYQSSDFSSTDIINRNSDTKLRNSNKKHQQAAKTIQALIHTEQDHSDEYYKRIESGGDDSNYTTMHENHQGEYSIADQQTDRCLGNEIDAGGSVIISVPTMLRQEDDIEITTDGAESIYNPNYSTRSNNRSNLTFKSPRNMKPMMTNSIIVGHCQTDFQPLNPKLLEKSHLAEHQQLYTCSQSLQFSAYDSGFFDDQTTDSLILTPRNEENANDEICSIQSRASSSIQDSKLAKTYC